MSSGTHCMRAQAEQRKLLAQRITGRGWRRRIGAGLTALLVALGCAGCSKKDASRDEDYRYEKAFVKSHSCFVVEDIRVGSRLGYYGEIEPPFVETEWKCSGVDMPINIAQDGEKGWRPGK